MQTKVVSIVNQKGGTGKTTTTINLGCALAKMGKKVLLLDLDPQANLTYSLGVTEPEYSMVDVFGEEKTLSDIITETEGGVSVAPGHNDMADIDISLVNQENRESLLKNHLKNIRGKYDYILIDAPPSLSLLTLNALNASDEVLIPLQLEVLTLQGLSQIINTVRKIKMNFNPELTIKGIVFVMYDKRRKLSDEVFSYIRNNVEERIFKTLIRSNVKIAEAPSFGKSVIDYDPNSHGASDYMDLAREYVSNSQGKANSRRKL
jgi:chromosome partitioning protein